MKTILGFFTAILVASVSLGQTSVKDGNFLGSSKSIGQTTSVPQTAAQQEALWETNFHQAPIDPIRRVDTLLVAANGPGFAKFWGSVTSAGPGGLLLAGSYTCKLRPPDLLTLISPPEGRLAVLQRLSVRGYGNVVGAFSGTFVLTNFPPGRFLPGDSFKFQDPWWARVSGIVTVSTTNFDRMKGAFTISTTNYHSLDYGEVVVLTDEQKASAKAAAQKSVDEQARSLQDKALKSNQDAADKGDAYGQLRMGQRYRDGDGVPKDLAKAKEYFAKAAAQGDKQAANSLEQLNAANP
jgi:hypothetical protein